MAPCPNCRAPIRGLASLGEAATLSIELKDAVVGKPDKPLMDLPTTWVYVDHPIHKNEVHDSGPMSPFIRMFHLLQPPGPNGSPSLGIDPRLVDNAPTLSMLITEARYRRWENFTKVLAKLGKQIGEDLHDDDIAQSLTTSAMLLFNGWFGTQSTAAFAELQPLRHFLPRVPDALKQLVLDDLKILERQCFAAIQALLEMPNSVLPGLYVERLRHDADFDETEYRLMRDDAEEVLDLFLGIFEAVNTAGPILLMLSNLQQRGDAEKCSDGVSRSYRKLRKLSAFDRDPLLRELSSLHALYGALDRKIRNKKGHNRIEYDYESGDVLIEGRDKMSLLVLHIQFLAAARLLGVLFFWTIGTIGALGLYDPGTVGSPAPAEQLVPPDRSATPRGG